jgi:hypothetical protein
LGCCLNVEVQYLLRKAVVRQKLEVGQKYFHVLFSEKSPVVACSMAAAGFAACMGSPPETVLQVGSPESL